MRDILLIDNGSKRPEATLNLRAIAARLGEWLGERVRPVSLLHADAIPTQALHGEPALLFEPFLRARLEAGVRDVVILPLFFGPSRAIGVFVPEILARLRETSGPFEARIAPELCPLPEGEPALVEILLDHVQATAAARGLARHRVILVDHGSPVPAVTAVRQWLAARLAERLGATTPVDEAVMERRPGREYDFNGELLDARLRALAEEDPTTPIILAMLFLSPGRHAGPGGDIAEISDAVQRDEPRLRIHATPLIGQHPRLIDLLARRVLDVRTR